MPAMTAAQTGHDIIPITAKRPILIGREGSS
jgi:hypothetical protein